MRKHFGAILVLTLLGLTACTYQKTNRIEQDDINAGNDFVYGHPDSTARQRKVQYTPNPENEVRAMEIQEKLYGASGE